MSVFLFLEKVSEEKAKVMCIHNFPDMLSEEEKQNGVLVDFYPEATPQAGKIALPYWNYTTSELFFEYVESEGSNTENIAMVESVQEDNTFIAETLALALMEIEQLKEEVTTLKGAQ